MIRQLQLLLIAGAFAILLNACDRVKPDDINSIKGISIIEIKKPSFYFKTIDFNSYFKTWRIIPLETSKDALIGRISRIYHYNKRFYILDRQSKSIFIFAENGKFLYKIYHLGRGPGEYTGIIDFTVDKQNGQLILQADRPAKSLFFDLDGRYLKEVNMTNYFPFITHLDNHLLYVNLDPSLDYNFFIKKDNETNSAGSNKIGTIGKLFENARTMYPYAIQSKSTYIIFPYSPIVFEFKDGAVKPRYGIDYKDAAIPKDFFDKNLTGSKMIQASYQKHYGFALSNFRETANHLIFSYADNIMVIYDKRNKESTAFNFIENKEGLINFENYFAHDGEDNGILSVCEASFFTEQMRRYKNNATDWGKLADSVKNISLNINAYSNPLLIYYEFK